MGNKLKILTVCSGNNGNVPAPFITEQMESIRQVSGAEVDYFLIEGHGYAGYIKNLPKLLKWLRAGSYDLIHAHYGLSALFANLQRQVPVVTTFHGCDVTDPQVRPFARPAYALSAHCIFVEDSMTRWFGTKRKQTVIPCGVDPSVFHPIPKQEARARLGLQPAKRYVLFSSTFSDPRKNYALAQRAAEELDTELQIIELKGYKRDEVCLLLNAADVALLTSLREGSPQFIKEAMACNCPIVSTHVGDVERLLANSEGCFVSDFTPANVADGIQKALAFGQRTNGREQLLAQKLDLHSIARRIVDVYRPFPNKKVQLAASSLVPD